MRKRLLGSIAALAAGAGAAWGQPPVEPGAPALPPSLTAPLGPSPASPASAAPQPPLGGPPAFGGFPGNAIPGNAGFPPPPTIMPPGNYGPPSDPLGLGPVGGFGPPPSPMYPMPGPPGMQSWQPLPPDLAGARGYGNDGDGSGHGDGGLNYGNAPHWWFSGEYLLWFTNGQPVRYPLLTTGAPTEGGVVGAASTSVLVSNRDLGYNAFSGFRLTGGFFGDADRRFGFQLTGLYTERAANRQNFGALGPQSAGLPVLARPFIDATTGSESSVALSGPNFGAARAFVGTWSQTWSIEPEGVWNIYRSQPGTRSPWSLDFLAGYRFIQVREELRIQNWMQLDPQIPLPVFVRGPGGVIRQQIGPATTGIGGALVGGPAYVTLTDKFRVTNQINGLLLGLRAEGRYGMVTLDGYAKVAIGAVHERIEINGSGAFYDPTGRSGNALGSGGLKLGVGGGAGTVLGGVLANSGNIGTYNRDRFTAVPEAGFNVGIAITNGLTFYTGVSALYFPNIVRPGNLINPVVSSAAIPFSANYGNGAAAGPLLQIRETSNWLGGLNFGLRLRY
jgi:hypothetical protein